MKLCGTDGMWMDKAEMELQPWDAGSAEGTTFAFSSTPTDPQGMIKIITKADTTPFKGAEDIKPLGKITLKRVCDGQQSYTLKFKGKWSKEDHPTDFPNSAHFSPLIGASHSAMFHFWQAGGMASPGVKDVAEKGGNATYTHLSPPLSLLYQPVLHVCLSVCTSVAAVNPSIHLLHVV